MPRSRRFAIRGWEPLEERELLTSARGLMPPPPDPVLPMPTSDPYTLMRLAQNLNEAAHGGDDVVFFGDSITDFWTTRGAPIWTSTMVPRHAADFGIVGDTTGNLLSRILAGELAGKPKVVVLMIGTNNVLKGDTAVQVVQGITACVNAIRTASPQSQVALMSLLPLNGPRYAALNPEVRTINGLISMLDDGSHVHYVDVGGRFLLHNGSVNRALFVDYAHPNIWGYAVWANALSGVLDSLTASRVGRR